MITLSNGKKTIPFQVTKFPDGTSQVWKGENIDQWAKFYITWNWENNESEIFHLVQLVDLIRSHRPYALIVLDMPYLPYARQDKEFSNNSTFAFRSFSRIINTLGLDEITCFDSHSNLGFNTIKDFWSDKPKTFHEAVEKHFRPDIVFYPDEGAARRYTRDINRIDLFGEKIRDQSTGEITGYKLCNLEFYKEHLPGSKILIVDDICDGGATFITAAKELMKYNPKEIALCVSHGIFSKGFKELHKSGIQKYYTTNTLNIKSRSLLNLNVFDIKKGTFI
jgi:ribose-phosphate pyrophosphokinase